LRGCAPPATRRDAPPPRERRTRRLSRSPQRASAPLLEALRGRTLRPSWPSRASWAACWSSASGCLLRTGVRELIASAEIFFESWFSMPRPSFDFPGSRRDCLRVGIEVFWRNFGHLRNRSRLRRCVFLAKIEAKRYCSSCIDAREITPYVFCGVLFIPCFDHSIPRQDKSSARKRMRKRSCRIFRPPYPEHLHEGVLTSPLMTR
jgi:hypothetical protein